MSRTRHPFDLMLSVDGDRITFRDFVAAYVLHAAALLAVLDLAPGESVAVDAHAREGIGPAVETMTITRLLPDLFYDRGARVWALLWVTTSDPNTADQVGEATHAHDRGELEREIERYAGTDRRR